MRAFFDRELDTAATFWRIFRKDGLALGFTSHDRDLTFGKMVHRAAPGMVPAAIRMTSDLSEDNAGVEGVLNHSAIRAVDLAAGLFDSAAIKVGIVNWENLESFVIYSGELGQIEENGLSFSGELKSSKHILERDLVPRTSPTCRAAFCGVGCGLSANRFTSLAMLEAIDLDLNRVRFAGLTSEDYLDGQVRFLEGPQTGLPFSIVSMQGAWLTLDRPLAKGNAEGTPAEVREGCDHTFQACSVRFDNAKNFRGEPFLPGNDLLARYGQGNS